MERDQTRLISHYLPRGNQAETLSARNLSRDGSQYQRHANWELKHVKRFSLAPGAPPPEAPSRGSTPQLGKGGGGELAAKNW